MFEIYAPNRLQTVADKHTGERKTVEAVKRVKEWFWTNDAGKLNLVVRYVSKILELAGMDELLDLLARLKEAVLAGELDAQVEAASGA